MSTIESNTDTSNWHQGPQRALITGITGQDGSYLAELLLQEGSAVAGFYRAGSTGHLGNVAHLGGQIELFRGNLDDETSIERALADFRPTEIYNLGAEAAPFDSFRSPSYTTRINHVGALNVFIAARNYRDQSGTDIRIYQASTSEMFGGPSPEHVPQDESTPMIPNNHYGVAKWGAHRDAAILREGATKLNIRCGILFNHESPRRGKQYVTRKVTVGVACIVNGVENLPLNELGHPILNSDRKLEMGDLYPKRDWGYSPEYVEGMRRIMRHPKPQDIILATGETHSIEDWLEYAFGYVGLDWRDHVVTSPSLQRPLETGPLCGNPTKAKQILGWEAKIKAPELAKIMVDADLDMFRNIPSISLPSSSSN